MMEGLRRSGVNCNFYTNFNGQPRGDIAVAYGWIHEPIFKAYKRYAYWDLGYWGRRPNKTPQDGYHRLALHDWDTAKHMMRDCPADRFERDGPALRQPARAPCSTALVAGMSIKAAKTHGYRCDDWELGAAAALRSLGWRAVQRPKSPKRAAQLQPIEEALANCGLLATHHSNCAVDALIAGVPVWAIKGVGRLISCRGCPTYPDVKPPSEEERRAFLVDLAYAQWSVAEMRSGAAWSFIAERLQCD
jgi:hypothetical protein